MMGSKPTKTRSRNVKRIAGVALTVTGVCAIAVASASAQLFHATVIPGLLLGRATNMQLFKPSASSGEITCKNAFTEGAVSVALGLQQLISVFYSKCTAFGVFTSVKISAVKYLLSADGLVAIKNTFEIEVEGVCEITVNPQDLRTAKYKNSGKSLVVESNISGITSEGDGGPCGTTNTGGVYLGSDEISEDGGGTISWG